MHITSAKQLAEYFGIVVGEDRLKLSSVIAVTIAGVPRHSRVSLPRPH